MMLKSQTSLNPLQSASRRRLKKYCRDAVVIATFAILSACASSPTTVPAPVQPPAPPPVTYPAPVLTSPQTQTSDAFKHLPNWGVTTLEPSVSAFKRSCLALRKKSADAPLSSVADWAGSVSEWLPACDALSVAQNDASAVAIMELLFVPIEVTSPDGKSRFTGYFEPTYEARRTPQYPFTEPVPAKPADLIPNGANPMQRLANGSQRPYPSRAAITADGVAPIAYAHPSDVFFMQIQGSGRLQFPDGTSIRAAYAAHNGHPFRSTANWLLKQGKITSGQASMQGIRAWMDRVSPAEARQAMNANPRFVFFNALPIGDPRVGPNGAQSVPLTALGSMAVDTDIMPLGLPMYVNTTAPGLGGDWAGLLISQDTGGAIKGAVRGDIYFGTGVEAGRRAGTMNAPGRLWVFLPHVVATRLMAEPMSAAQISSAFVP